jgi:hypothetical protein
VETSHPELERLTDGTMREVRHDQSIFLAETRLGAEYGLTDHLAVAIMLPFRVVDAGIVYVDATTGDPVSVADEIHHRDETLAGLADPWISAHGAWRLGSFVLDGRLGVSLPVGETEEDPFVLGDLGLEHQHIQFGTGTVNPIVSVSLARPFARWRLAAWGLAQLVLYENDRGYRAGDRFAGGCRRRRRSGPRAGASRRASRCRTSRPRRGTG